MNRVEAWSEARYWTFIRSGLRQMWSRYPNKYQCLKNARVGRNQYLCAGCSKIFPSKKVAVDHIVPCGTLNSFETMKIFASNLFCSLDNLQVLCKDVCHYKKTMQERGITEEDLKVIQFKKLTAAQQRQELLDMGIIAGSNQVNRCEQYRNSI